MDVFQTHFNEKTSISLWEFVLWLLCIFLQTIGQLVKIVSVCFLTMGPVLCGEVVSGSSRSGRAAWNLRMCFPTGGFDSEKKNMDLFQSEINLAKG